MARKQPEAAMICVEIPASEHPFDMTKFTMIENGTDGSLIISGFADQTKKLTKKRNKELKDSLIFTDAGINVSNYD